MPRHYVDYPEAFAFWNRVSSYGSYITTAGLVVFLFAMFYAYFIRKEKAADNPWGVGATTLEWTLPSPPAFHSYETLPRIARYRSSLIEQLTIGSGGQTQCGPPLLQR